MTLSNLVQEKPFISTMFLAFSSMQSGELHTELLHQIQTEVSAIAVSFQVGACPAMGGKMHMRGHTQLRLSLRFPTDK
jgi:hypothetical protein